MEKAKRPQRKRRRDYNLGPRILEIVASNPGISPKSVSKIITQETNLAISDSTVPKAFQRMLRNGELEKMGRGGYKAASTVASETPTISEDQVQSVDTTEASSSVQTEPEVQMHQSPVQSISAHGDRDRYVREVLAEHAALIERMHVFRRHVSDPDALSMMALDPDTTEKMVSEIMTADASMEKAVMGLRKTMVPERMRA